jgi:DNA primase large subunit
MSRHGEPPDEQELVELPVEPLDEREAAFIKLLAEAIASDIKRGGAIAREPLDEPDEEISAAAEETAAEVRKAEEAGDEP